MYLSRDGALEGTTDPGLKGPRSNCNKRLLYIPQNSRIEKKHFYCSIVSYLGQTTLFKAAVSFPT